MFDCDNFLRVGVRRWKTQTLYISELVDVLNCSNPNYGKLMVAIKVAILHDVIERLPFLDLSLAKGMRLHAGNSRQWPWDNTEAPASVRHSRRKFGATPNEMSPEAGHTINVPSSGSMTNLQEMKHELHTQNIALLCFQHGNYHSSSLLFLRRPNSLGRQRSHRYDACLALLIGKRLGQGAIREVYEAQLLVDMPSGNTARYPEKVVIKLALLEDQKERIRHEYAIYRRLLYGPMPVAAGDIPTAFGFFEDIESDA
ncbi:hypothetical protein EDD18DRAFT_1330467 [Armillaria luteobubalina]|uniref:Uncharacterized protein n=1 Tax=Armillaria luteobubalina TaxID=153913 RepID=A0AA39Q9S8_9AGAR|nr:hypothetical protein EDD18DRAFT_1330467 [Armillaria luteobubalina]